MSRVRTDFVRGTVDDAPLTDVAVTLNSTELADLPAIAGGDVAVIVIDPEGTPEIVHVSAHVAAATSATILRGQEGTAALEHVAGTVWKHGPTAEDFDSAPIAAGAVIGSVTLTDTRPNSLALVQWGSEELVIAEGDLPGADFVALVWLRGRARKIGTVTQHRRYQYGIQYNLGAGWVDFSPATIIGTDSSNLTTTRTPTPDHGFVSLTSTGSGIQFRAVCSDVDVANDFNFELGRLSGLVAAV